MALDLLPSKLLQLSRDERREKFLRDYKIRKPDADTRPGGEPYFDASVFADATDAHASNALRIANGASRATAQGAELDEWATILGTTRQDAKGAAGAVYANTSAGGATIFEGDVATHQTSSIKFQCTATALYANGQQIPMSGVSTGPETNLPAGTILSWEAPRPGSAATAVVVLQPDGEGMSGGATAENDEQLRLRLDQLAANPPASGNDAEYQKRISETPSIAVEQPFTYPAIKGSGTVGYTLTLRPARPGGDRTPTPTQLALARVYFAGKLPADDAAMPITIAESPVGVVLEVEWARQASAGWRDSVRWPPYFVGALLVKVAVPAGGSITPTLFRLTSTSLSATTAPQVGQTIAFFDLANLAFRPKKILTVTVISGTTYDIVVDVANGVSDVSFTPALNQTCCPWSDSLDSLVPPVVAYFDQLGPGEMFDDVDFFDPGIRQRRQPQSPELWPSQVTHRLLGGYRAPVPASGAPQNLPPVPTLFTTDTVGDVGILEPDVPYGTPVGSPGVSVYMLALSNLLAFPEI